MTFFSSSFSSIFSTESVSEGHPDKIADQIAEAVLDSILESDSDAHLACEVMVTGQRIIVSGEIKSKNIKKISTIDEKIKKIVWSIIEEKIGYNNQTWKNLKNLKIDVYFVFQSLEISEKTITHSLETTAGDNSNVFGYAEWNIKTNHYPPAQFLANNILKKIHKLRHNLHENVFFKFAPDGKIQILMHKKVLKKIILCQHFFEKLSIIEKKEIKNKIQKLIIEPLSQKIDLIFAKDFVFELISFVHGGPSADTGTTGRKLMIDTYGSFSRHGGGSFAGKDLSKPDKTLALFARFLAKNIIDLKLTTWIEIQISTHIGQQKNFSLSYQTVKESPEISKLLHFFSQWTFQKIIDYLELKKVFFQKYAHYGYFARDEKDAFWEIKKFPKKIN